MTWPASAAAVLALLTLAACASAPVPPPQATLENIQALRANGFAPMRVGEFTAAAGPAAAMDKKISIRAATQAAPNGSYTRFLADTLAAELAGAGKLDAGSPLVVSGVLTAAHVDSAMPTAHASLQARFKLTKAGAVAYDKTLDADASWSSDFMGAVAIPDAFNHYNALFPALVSRLLADPDFKAAAKP